MDLIKFVHGQDVNLYTDVLRVNATASDQDIQSAFVARRYELFNELQSASDTKIVAKTPKAPPGSSAVTMSEKQFTEKKMDALIASYRLLSNSEKRRQYNLSLYLSSAQKSRNVESPNDVRCMTQTPTTTSSHEKFNDGPNPDVSGDRNIVTPFTPYKNKNGGASPLTKEPSPSSDTSSSVKKQLFVSYNDQVEDVYNEHFADHKHNGTTERDRDASHRNDQSFESSIVSDSIQDTYSDTSFMEDQDSKLDENNRNHKSQKEKKDLTPQDRKVRWSKSTDNTASQKERRRRLDKHHVVANESNDEDSEVEEKMRSSRNKEKIIFRKARSKKNPSSREVAYESEDSDVNEDSGMLSSWLRSYNLTDQADMVDNITREISGAAADTVSAFNQILNAFTIDDEAIDSVAGNIVDATEDLETFKS